LPGKYGAKDVTVSYDDAGGVLRAVTNHILEMGGIKIESAMELTHAMGDTADESTPSGHISVPDINLGGVWDTTATTGPHVVFGVPDSDPQGATRTLVVVFGDGKTFTAETRLVSYEVLGNNGALTRFAAVVRVTGVPVWS
jgi:hypothetical protein